jgi:hypothetical protein
MVQVFESWVHGRDVLPEDIAIMREAYIMALQELSLVESEVERRRALAEILLQLTKVESFKTAEQMASLAVNWYRSRQG